MTDFIVVGAGYAGAICARRIAEEMGKKVLLIDKRNHVAGNMYDKFNDVGILTHMYGPHISVMNEEKAFDFLSRFTDWIPYHHIVEAEILSKQVPLPFNFTSIDRIYETKEAVNLKNELIATYGFGENIPILTLRGAKSQNIRNFAELVYENVFLHYTMKMWGLSPEQIDPAVTARIPVRLSYDNRHFLHKYQVMPKDGFTVLFQNMLDHENIKIKLNTKFSDIAEIADNKILIDGNEFNGKIIYTGALDELFNFDNGVLPYRSLHFEFENHNKDYIQNPTVLNWPDSRPATRRTEMKRLTSQIKEGITTTLVEYPGEFKLDDKNFGEPYYAIDTKECKALYNTYKERANKIQGFYTVGRLADYRYYNMEATILRAFDEFENYILRGGKK